MKRIIDVCCGSKMFWFDKDNPDVEFCDIRTVPKTEYYPGRYIEVSPDTVCNFTELPFFEMFDCPQCGCQNAVGIYEQQIVEENNKKERIIKMAEKVVIKIKKVNGENVIRIKGNPESKYHINLMAQKLRLGEIKPTKMLRIKRFFKKLNRVVKQLAEEICDQPKVDRIKPPMMAERIQPNIYLDFKEEV